MMVFFEWLARPAVLYGLVLCLGLAFIAQMFKGFWQKQDEEQSREG